MRINVCESFCSFLFTNFTFFLTYKLKIFISRDFKISKLTVFTDFKSKLVSTSTRKEYDNFRIYVTLNVDYNIFFGVRKVTSFYQFMLNIFAYKRSTNMNLSTAPLLIRVTLRIPPRKNI